MLLVAGADEACEAQMDWALDQLADEALEEKRRRQKTRPIYMLRNTL